jgi:hypothetical protein
MSRLPRSWKMRNLEAMPKTRSPRKASVCLLAFHPLVLTEFERLLSDFPFSVQGRRLEPDLIADPTKLMIPKASIFILESHLTVPRAKPWSSASSPATRPAG